MNMRKLPLLMAFCLALPLSACQNQAKEITADYIASMPPKLPPWKRQISLLRMPTSPLPVLITGMEPFFTRSAFRQTEQNINMPSMPLPEWLSKKSLTGIQRTREFLEKPKIWLIQETLTKLKI